MRIVTSFAPGREARQHYCLATWRAYGLPIVAVQTAAEMPAMVSQYTDVDWIRSASDRPLIKELAEVAITTGEPVLIVNSDISIKNTFADFRRDWLSPNHQHPGMLRVGIRWDRRSDGHKVMQKYGIDVFLITPPMAASLPELGFQIGKPGWDYWLVLHFASLGYRLSTKKSVGLIHSRHALNWTKQDQASRKQIFFDHYGFTASEATRTVQKLTGRK